MESQELAGGGSNQGRSVEVEALPTCRVLQKLSGLYPGLKREVEVEECGEDFIPEHEGVW